MRGRSGGEEKKVDPRKMREGEKGEMEKEGRRGRQGEERV